MPSILGVITYRQKSLSSLCFTSSFLDDFLLTPVDQAGRSALLDLVEERYDKASTIIATQIPVAEWHGLIGESTVADAILDRLVYSSHRIELTGESLRKKKTLSA